MWRVSDAASPMRNDLGSFRSAGKMAEKISDGSRGHRRVTAARLSAADFDGAKMNSLETSEGAEGVGESFSRRVESVGVPLLSSALSSVRKIRGVENGPMLGLLDAEGRGELIASGRTSPRRESRHSLASPSFSSRERVVPIPSRGFAATA